MTRMPTSVWKRSTTDCRSLCGTLPSNRMLRMPACLRPFSTTSRVRCQVENTTLLRIDTSRPDNLGCSPVWGGSQGVTVPFDIGRYGVDGCHKSQDLCGQRSMCRRRGWRHRGGNLFQDVTADGNRCRNARGLCPQPSVCVAPFSFCTQSPQAKRMHRKNWGSGGREADVSCWPSSNRDSARSVAEEHCRQTMGPVSHWTLKVCCAVVAQSSDAAERCAAPLWREW